MLAHALGQLDAIGQGQRRRGALAAAAVEPGRADDPLEDRARDEPARQAVSGDGEQSGDEDRDEEDQPDPLDARLTGLTGSPGVAMAGTPRHGATIGA